MKVNLFFCGQFVKVINVHEESIVGLLLSGSVHKAQEKINQLQKDLDNIIDQPEEETKE